MIGKGPSKVHAKVQGTGKPSTGKRTRPAPPKLQAGSRKGDGERQPGIYALLFALARDTTVTVGKLGQLTFPGGSYVYIGSGMAGVETRIRHHLRPHPHPRWHLDYLLPRSKPATVIASHTDKRLECPLATSLARQFKVWPRFGSSDCRCRGHLFHSEEMAPLASAVLDAIQDLGCEPLVLPASRRRYTAKGQARLRR